MKLRIGTRGSQLARIQAGNAAVRLARLGHESEIVAITTAGDRSSAPTFAAIGPQGVFVREIERALLDGVVDLAVHSHKDLPTDSPDELVVAAVPERRDPSDALVIRADRIDSDRSGSVLPVPEDALIGTASVRRQVWLRHFRSDLRAESLRGNVLTRIRRLREGSYDAILLALAGIDRLRTGPGSPGGASDAGGAEAPLPPRGEGGAGKGRVSADGRGGGSSIAAPHPRSPSPGERGESRSPATPGQRETAPRSPALDLDGLKVIRLDPSVFVPAPAQGALAFQCRRSDGRVREALAPLDHAPTREAVEAERALLARLEGGCELAFGAWCGHEPAGNESVMVAMVERDGEVRRETARGADPRALAEDLWRALSAAPARPAPRPVNGPVRTP